MIPKLSFPRKRESILIITLWSMLSLASSSFSEEVLRLATTTSTYETGLLDHILPPFEERHNVRVHIISVGTGKAIKLGEGGDVDVILVHAPDAEEKFVAEGYGMNRQAVMCNDFVLLGPDDDLSGIEGLKDITQALKKIYDAKYTFISRGDDSGTDRKEKYLWRKTGLSPKGAWYLETGQGMSATLRVADEKNGYCLIDRATYLFNSDQIRLKKLVEGDRDLLNPYSAIAVSPSKYPDVNYKLAIALIEWLISPECQGMIDGYRIGGNKLFYGLHN